MDIELKTKWVAALRSGNYKQGKGVLYSKYQNTFCCLGVLGNIMGISKEYLHGKGLLWAFESKSPLSSLTESELSRMNDTGSTFSEIADHIEKIL